MHSGRNKEFAIYKPMACGLLIILYFCKPYHSWKRTAKRKNKQDYREMHTQVNRFCPTNRLNSWLRWYGEPIKGHEKESKIHEVYQTDSIY